MMNGGKRRRRRRNSTRIMKEKMRSGRYGVLSLLHIVAKHISHNHDVRDEQEDFMPSRSTKQRRCNV